jgi:hypothetical protein
MASEIPGARVVSLTNVDHVIAMRAPDEFNETVLAFIDDVVETR